MKKIYIKCNIWRVAVRPSYIYDARFLKVKQDRRAYNVTYRCICATTVAVEKQKVLHILCVCL